jgi:flagellar FliL protein
MAENKKEDQPQKEVKKAADVKETKSEEKDEETQEGKGSKAFPLKLIIILVLVLLVAGGGFMVWKKMAASKEKKGQVVAINDKDKGQLDMGPTYPMETFIVNLQDPSGRRYLKLQIVLELDNENLKQEIDHRMPQFKDGIISLLSSKTVTDINAIEGKMQLRAELTAMFNQYLKSGKITNVFFMDFIIQ